MRRQDSEAQAHARNWSTKNERVPATGTLLNRFIEFARSMVGSLCRLCPNPLSRPSAPVVSVPSLWSRARLVLCSRQSRCLSTGSWVVASLPSCAFVPCKCAPCEPRSDSRCGLFYVMSNRVHGMVHALKTVQHAKDEAACLGAARHSSLASGDAPVLVCEEILDSHAPDSLTQAVSGRWPEVLDQLRDPSGDSLSLEPTAQEQHVSRSPARPLRPPAALGR